jgi:hypothetical protein
MAKSEILKRDDKEQLDRREEYLLNEFVSILEGIGMKLDDIKE